MFKRKVVESVKEVITAEKAEDIVKNLTSVNINFKEVEIEKLVPNVIDNVLIFIDKDGFKPEVIQKLSDTTGKVNFRLFRLSEGGVFVRDLNKYIKGEFKGKYGILTTKTEKQIIRLVEEDELLDFCIKDILKGKIKDKPYIVLKTIGLEDELTTTKMKKDDHFNLVIQEEIEKEKTEELVDNTEIDNGYATTSLF